MISKCQSAENNDTEYRKRLKQSLLQKLFLFGFI